MRALSLLLGVVLVVCAVGQAAAQPAQSPQGLPDTQGLPEWNASNQGGRGGVCYAPSEASRDQAKPGPEQERAQRFQEVEKFQFNQRMHAFAGEPVLVREQPLQAAPGEAMYCPPLIGPEQARALAFHDVEKFRLDERVRAFAGQPVIREQPLTAGPFAAPRIACNISDCFHRPPTYIALDQEKVTDISPSPLEVGPDGCWRLRSVPISPLQQVNNRQFAPQWHM